MIVTCNGCFDGIHPGHLFFLGFCRGLGDELIVGINSDEYITNNKRKEPNYDEESRINALLSLGFVKDVFVFKEKTPDDFIKKIKPNIHCTGEEYGYDCPESDVCREIGTKLVLVPRISGFSTTYNSDCVKDFVSCFMNERI
jgi:rfaE bifunctional protein nucleotidyltransferase chain/domain